MTTEERFWEKVNKNGPTPDPSIYGEIGQCWTWTAGRHPQGYGIFSDEGRVSVRANRKAYQLTNGEIPDSLWILHKCDNPPCVNPEHLESGTPSENTRSAVRRGRLKPFHRVGPLPGVQGEKHGMAKLTNEDVLIMRALFAVGEATKKQLASEFCVTPHYVSKILRRDIWKHI